MAGGRSQRHLREIQGVDSAGETAADYGEQFNNFGVLGINPPAAADITMPSGTTVSPAVVTLSGTWDGLDTVNLNVDTDTAAGQSAGPFVPSTGTPAQVATELAPLIQAALTDVSVTANLATLEFLAVNTATTVTVNSVTLT